MKKNSVSISSGWAKGMVLGTPSDLRTRPTASRVREAVLNSLSQMIEGSRFLDLFAGSGAMGIEAASRGAQTVVFVESDATVSRILRKNIDELLRRAQVQKLRHGSYELIQGDVTDLWEQSSWNQEKKRPSKADGPDSKKRGSSLDFHRLKSLSPFDVIYADPPYAHVSRILEPFLNVIHGYLGIDGVFVLETRSGEDSNLVKESIEKSEFFEMIQTKTYGTIAITMMRKKGIL